MKSEEVQGSAISVKKEEQGILIVSLHCTSFLFIMNKLEFYNKNVLQILYKSIG
jgi:hypothetical protein